MIAEIYFVYQITIVIRYETIIIVENNNFVRIDFKNYRNYQSV